MTTTTKPLFSPQIVNIAESVLYQVPVSTTTVISYLSLHNTSTTPVKITVSTPVSGELSSTANQLTVKTLAGLETLRVYDAVGYTMATGQSIRAFADTDGAVNIRAGGAEIT